MIIVPSALIWFWQKVLKLIGLQCYPQTLFRDVVKSFASKAGNFVGIKQTVPLELLAAIEKIYHPAGLLVTTEPVLEAEGGAYQACRFSLAGKNIVFRVAKTTPIKIGQFVTFSQRRSPQGLLVPLDVADGVDFAVVQVSAGKQQGQFIFERALLVAQGVLSRNGKGGKMAIRVYPPWSKPQAKQAIKSQEWQLTRFLPLAEDGSADITLTCRYLPENFKG